MVADLGPDLALLQEVADMPLYIREAFHIEFRTAVGRTGKPQKFGTAILTKGEIICDLPLPSEYEWVNLELEAFRGSLVSSVVRIGSHSRLNVVSVHSPAWPVDTRKHRGVDLTNVRLEQNPNVWVADLLWAGLRNADSGHQFWIVGGDLNASETFDLTFGRGNCEFLDRMKSLGFTECLREYNGKLTPTFRNTGNGKAIHQIDHLFVSDSLYRSLDRCITGDDNTVFGRSISDHLPIIADFRA